MRPLHLLPLGRSAYLVIAALLALVLTAACQQETATDEEATPAADASPGGTTEEATVGDEPTPEDAPAVDGPTADEPTDAEPTDPAPAEDPPAEVALEVTTVATGLEAPWEVVMADGRTFVTERDTGAVLELGDDGSTQEIARLAVNPAGEGGLLGLIADPDAEGLGFLAYLTTAEDNRVVRFAPGGEPEPVLTGIPSANIHNGGRIAIGPDDLLYIATGDAGSANLAQDPSSLAGKILRVGLDGEVPDDNPTAGSPVYALGLRNTQGLAWTADGALYAAEFGPDRDDEVNRIEPGANYGWPEVTAQAGVEGFTDPVFVQQPPEASWSGITALVDGAIPQWEGNLFVAALRGERLWRLTLDGDGQVADAEALLVGEYGRLRQVVQAPDGALWILTSNRDGRGSPIAEDDRLLRLGPAG